MQLTVQEASSVLNVSESTLLRWVKQRGLPSRHVGGRHRFHRSELLEWATANHIKVSMELFDDLNADDEPVPSLVAALEAGGIFYHLQDTNKERALRALVEVLPLPDGVDRELVLRLYLARESSASTAIGNGIALPHIRNPMVLEVTHPLVTLAFLERPVDFGALDGKPVQVLFSLICPTMRSHLQLLSRLSFSLHDEKFQQSVLQQQRPEKILQEARRVEASVANPDAGKDAR